MIVLREGAPEIFFGVEGVARRPERAHRHDLLRHARQLGRRHVELRAALLHGGPVLGERGVGRLEDRRRAGRLPLDGEIGDVLLRADHQRQPDLLLAREERHLADLAQVHAHRIVAEVIHLLPAERIFLLALDLLELGVQRLLLDPVLGATDGDALRAQRLVDGLQLVRGHVGFREARDHLFLGQAPPRPGLLDQAFDEGLAVTL